MCAKGTVRHRTLDACGLPTALAASSAADRAGCMRGDPPPGTATVGRVNDCDLPDRVDSDAERLAGGDSLSACVRHMARERPRWSRAYWRAGELALTTRRRW